MKMTFLKSLAASATMLLLAGAAHADRDENHGCTQAMLKGFYIFHASGFNIVNGVAQPKAIVETIHFNGDGSTINGATTVSLNGAIFRSAPGVHGAYTVNADCTGSISFSDGGANPTFDLFIGAEAATLYMIQTKQSSNSSVFAGTAERVH